LTTFNNFTAVFTHRLLKNPSEDFKKFTTYGAIMNALNQIAIEIQNAADADFADQTVLVLDALDLAAVGGGADIVLA
jgi:hypothetical protein